ncbi:MAG TPA: phosphatase PAP2 family protein [Actinomycetota bacterium]|nr:phosphatase PAP2 family protein [Actinomycetota bacterium]
MSPAARKGALALLQAAIGVAVLVLSANAVHPNLSPAWERDVFDVVNDLPELLYWPAWVVMQLGNLLVIPAAAIAAAALRKWKLALAILLAGAAKLQIALLIKDQWTRERPAAVIDDVTRRGDASAAGEAFVSGHAIIAFSLAVLVSPYLSRRWRAVVWGLAAGVCIGRVFVGAHLPLDVVAGGAVGWAVGAVLDWALGPWWSHRPQTDGERVRLRE